MPTRPGPDPTRDRDGPGFSSRTASVLEARDGADALRVMTAARGGVSLVLADVIMGGMGGGELRDRLAEEVPSPPVLLMSGHAPDELLGRRLVSGEDQLLQKPFDITQLDQRIRQLLNARTSSPRAEASHQ